jgi:polar amino acid transport system permease protein
VRQFNLGDFEFLLLATRWTILLSIYAAIGGGIVGLAIALMRTSGSAALRWLAVGYIRVFQGTPLLLQLFLVFFGGDMLGIPLGAWMSAILGFSLNAGAFLGEIWRGCLQAIPRTQWEAGASLGLSFTAQLRYIIVPQATRLAIPPTVGFLVQLIKNTSLAAVIGFIELTREGQLTTATTFRPFTVYLTVAALYFALCFPLTQVSRRLERRLHVAR